MRLFPLLAAALVTTAAAPADQRDRGPGIAGERRGDAVAYRADGFTAVAFGLPGQVEVRVGPAWSVRAQGPAAAFANVRVVRNGDDLEIGHRYSGREDAAERQLHFVVTLPRLAAASLGGSGAMAVDRVRGTAFDASLGGSGSMTLGTIEVARATVSIGGSGNVVARGSAGSLTVNLGGSGSLRGPGLRAAGARISTAGSGSVELAVDGPAQVSTVGSGKVNLGPRARCSVTRMGSATVRCGG